MIEAVNISKSFGNTRALENISFSIDRSEIFGFLGPDGAGKTTLFRIMATLLLPERGSMSVMGFDSVKDYRKLRTNIGYMPGRFSLYRDLTVEENLKFYATVFGTSIEENYSLIEEIYSQLEPFRKRYAGRLSGGMKQKLALCCALIHAPDLIILDEPTTGVDAVSRAEFWEMLHRLKKKGITIIVSTPYMDEAGRCDRVALMQSGRILMLDQPGHIAASFGSLLHAVSSDNRFSMINILREHPSVDSVNPFGDSVHITWKNDSYDPSLKKYLAEKGLEKIEITEIDPGIEDTFLKLMRHE